MNKLWQIALCGFWIFFLAVSFPLGWILSLFAIAREPPLASLSLAFALAGCVIGLVIGVAQWFILDQFLPSIHLWVLATVLGWCFAGGIFGQFLLRPHDILIPGFYLFFIVGGTISGVLQWLLLRIRTTKSRPWLLFMTLGWVAGGLLAWTGPEGDSIFIAETGLMGLVAGLATVPVLYGIISEAGGTPYQQTL